MGEPRDLDVTVASLLAEMLDMPVTCRADAETAVQVFNGPGGRAVLAWDVPAMEAWSFEYRAGIEPLRYEAPEVARTIEVPIEPAECLVYDLWADRLDERTAEGGRLRLALQGTMVGQWYIGLDTPAFRELLVGVRETRARMAELGFDG